MSDLPDTLDLGGGRQLRFVGPVVDGRPIGAIEAHPHPEGFTCEGFLTFATAPASYRSGPDGSERPSWQVESWEPLTLSPSLQCTACPSHGWVRAGRWVPA